MNKVIISAIIAGVLGSYVAMLYAVVQIIVSIDHSYLMSLAM